MAFTATLDLVEKQDDGRVRLLITYTDGISKSQQNLFVDSSFDATALKNVVINRIVQLSSLDNLKKNLVLGPIDTTVPGPTPEEQAKSKYFADLAKFQSVTQLVSNGILDAGAQEYVDQKAAVIAGYKKEYYGL